MNVKTDQSSSTKHRLSSFVKRFILVGLLRVRPVYAASDPSAVSKLTTGHEKPGQTPPTIGRDILLPIQQSDTVNRSRNAVLRFLLYGTLIVSFLLLLALLQSYFVAGHHYVAGRIWFSAASLAIMIVTYVFVRRKNFTVAAYLLVIFYAFVSILMVWRWGINLPAGLLFACITIVLSGMLLDPAKSLYMAGFLVVSFIILQTALDQGAYKPDTSWAARSSNYGDIVGYAVIFAMIALVSWLFGREIVRSLARAEEAEAGLLEEKMLLETRVIERTAKIRVMQLEKVQQLQRFAELGQLSTAMMHELANRLTSLSLDIESLHGQQQSDALQRAQHSLRYIDSMAKNVGKRLHGLPVQRPFDTIEHTKKVVRSLSQKAGENGVSVYINLPDSRPGALPAIGVKPVGDTKSGADIPKAQKDKTAPLKTFGDSVQFAQIITVVVSNALEAYKDLPAKDGKPKIVNVDFSVTDKQITIRVIDFGKGIDREHRSLLFEPFNSSKKQGMGVGLYIAKTMLTDHFQGDVQLNPATDRTEFDITLPHYTKS
jgi:signal transduction histidine kinase